MEYYKDLYNEIWSLYTKITIQLFTVELKVLQYENITLTKHYVKKKRDWAHKNSQKIGRKNTDYIQSSSINNFVIFKSSYVTPSS